MIKRSEFFRAARDSKWLSDPTKPTNLEDEDPEIFSTYLNCVYFGAEANRSEADYSKDHATARKREYRPLPDAFDLPGGENSIEDDELHPDEADPEDPDSVKHFEQRMDALVKTYLLADKLQDLQTANLVIDEIVYSCDAAGFNVSARMARLVYESTVHPNPMRKLLRDTLVHETYSGQYMFLHDSVYPIELARDAAVEFLRLKDVNCAKSIQSVYSNVDVAKGKDKCYYHQHSEQHPRCVPKPGQ